MCNNIPREINVPILPWRWTIDHRQVNNRLGNGDTRVDCGLHQGDGKWGTRALFIMCIEDTVQQEDRLKQISVRWLWYHHGLKIDVCLIKNFNQKPETRKIFFSFIISIPGKRNLSWLSRINCEVKTSSNLNRQEIKQNEDNWLLHYFILSTNFRSFQFWVLSNLSNEMNPFEIYRCPFDTKYG